MIDTFTLLYSVSLLEWLLLVQGVVLLTALFFYQIAKLIARQDRHDPLVRFYRVFWRAFFTPVTSMRQLELKEAEARAMAAGVSGVTEVEGADLSQLDPAEFFGDGDVGDGNPPPQQTARPIGRAGPEDDNVLRKPKDAESREAKFARQAKEARSNAPAAAPPARGRGETAEVTRAATSTFDALIIPFADNDRLVGFKAGEVVVNVKCAPEDGSANGVIINAVAERIGLRPYQIVLLRGHYKVRKTLQVAGLDQPTLNARLEGL
jgi:uncharacterized protein YggU (UPF0235/DUF167 family)